MIIVRMLCSLVVLLRVLHKGFIGSVTKRNENQGDKGGNDVRENTTNENDPTSRY
mgnify:CR=1 FL=1